MKIVLNFYFLVFTMILAEVLSEKICHDLSNPLSGLKISLENLENKDPKIKLIALEILTKSSNELVRKVKFFKEIYSCRKLEEKITIEEIIEHTESFLGKKNITINNQRSKQTIAIDVVKYKILMLLIEVADENKCNKYSIAICNNKIILNLEALRNLDIVYNKIRKLVEKVSNCDESVESSQTNYLQYLILKDKKTSIKVLFEEKKQISISINI